MSDSAARVLDFRHGLYSRAYSVRNNGPATDEPATLVAIWKDADGVEHRVITDCRGRSRWECLTAHMDLMRIYQRFFPRAPQPDSRPSK